MLQEQGYFVVDHNGEKISLRFCTWTFKRFSEKTGKNLQQLIETLGAGISIPDITELILCASEYDYALSKKEFTYSDIDACNWVDSLGGLNGNKFGELLTTIANSLVDKTQKNGQVKKKVPH